MSANTDPNLRKESLVQIKAPPAVVSLLPVTSAAEGAKLDPEASQKNLFGKVAKLLHRSMARSRESSITSDPPSLPSAQPSPQFASTGTFANPTKNSHLGQTISSPGSGDSPKLALAECFKETKHVSLEYDPKSRRKVLNSYEILREIGRGEHGKVKLARNLVNGELVAIKVMSRKSKDKLLRMRKSLNDHKANDYEAKIRREIAIMKRCDHKYIVKFKEVLDDLNLYKIYLVLEYMERGEIIWKRKSHHTHVGDSIPCASNTENSICKLDDSLASVASEDNDLMSYEFSPNLTFKQSRKVFRDVLLGLEYLHSQGIIHRDIKPANLLVSSDFTVKISDFGVSFASSLGSADDGQYFSEMELAKTVGTPAFFAPELCQTSFSKNSSFSNAETEEVASRSLDRTSLPKVDHKIDIWALGVTFYCLLFGRVPFNAESEFALFDVIVHQELEFPESSKSFNSPQPVSEREFELAKDLLRKLLDKNNTTRIDIEEIKQHPFVLMDLDDDAAELHELFFLNLSLVQNKIPFSHTSLNNYSRSGSTDNAVGVARRVNLTLLRAVNQESSVDNLTSDSSDSRLHTEPRASASHDSPCGLVPHAARALSGVSLHSNMSTASNNYHLRGRAGLIFHDMIDYGSNIRRDSTGSLEAPQIETKRNVGGDLYMKNQSAIDAFKDIQKTDKKQRKSSLYKTQSGSSSGNNRPLRTNERAPSLNAQLSQIPSSHSLSKIKVGPISIESGRRRSSVISLPLTESFASLDSLNDDYLSLKYHEHKKKKQTLKLMNENMAHSDSILDAQNQTTTQDISDKFRNFNLGTQMAKKSNGNSFENCDEIEPPTAKLVLKKPQQSSLSLSSDSSLSSSDSGEEGNLTLKFPSKVASSVRPPFLSLGNRAQSHDSNLQDLMKLPVKKSHNMQFVFQDLFDELEDVPEALMQSNSVEDFLEIVPIVSIMKPAVPEIEKVKKSHVTPSHSSPLRMEVVKASSPSATVPLPSTSIDFEENDDSTESHINNGYFNNHYNKEHVRSPFPLAKHLDGERGSSQPRHIELLGTRPNYNRSNSITLGLLQHERGFN